MPPTENRPVRIHRTGLYIPPETAPVHFSAETPFRSRTAGLPSVKNGIPESRRSVSGFHRSFRPFEQPRTTALFQILPPSVATESIISRSARNSAPPEPHSENVCERVVETANRDHILQPVTTFVPAVCASKSPQKRADPGMQLVAANRCTAIRKTRSATAIYRNIRSPTDLPLP